MQRQRSGPESRGTSFRGGPKSRGQAFEMDQRSCKGQASGGDKKKGGKLQEWTRKQGRHAFKTDKQKKKKVFWHLSIYILYF